MALDSSRVNEGTGSSRRIGRRGLPTAQRRSWDVYEIHIQPGPINTDLNPAAGDWAVPQKSVTALDRYGHVNEVAALVSFVGRSGVLVHHRGESDRGWRDKRLSSAHIRSTCRRMTHMLTETANREDNEYTHEQNCARDGRIKRELGAPLRRHLPKPARTSWFTMAAPRRKRDLSSLRSKRKADVQMQSRRTWELPTARRCWPNRCAQS
jgi:hypothetical protein